MAYPKTEELWKPRGEVQRDPIHTTYYDIGTEQYYDVYSTTYDISTRTYLVYFEGGFVKIPELQFILSYDYIRNLATIRIDKDPSL